MTRAKGNRDDGWIVAFGERAGNGAFLTFCGTRWRIAFVAGGAGGAIGWTLSWAEKLSTEYVGDVFSKGAAILRDGWYPSRAAGALRCRLQRSGEQ